jgi:hypothetical protein
VVSGQWTEGSEKKNQRLSAFIYETDKLRQIRIPDLVFVV